MVKGVGYAAFLMRTPSSWCCGWLISGHLRSKPLVMVSQGVSVMSDTVFDFWLSSGRDIKG